MPSDHARTMPFVGAGRAFWVRLVEHELVIFGILVAVLLLLFLLT